MSDAEAVEANVAAAARLIDAGNPTGAERRLAEALASDSEHPRAHALMALALYRRGRHHAALQQADVAIGLAPTTDALRYKALALIALNRFTQAIEAAEAAARADPENSLAALVQGIALEHAKRMPQAEAAFRRAVEVAPHSNSARASLGGFLLRQRDVAGAQAVAAGLDPGSDDPSALLLRGQLALHAHRADEARDMALWVLRQDANNASALRLLTQVKASRSPILGLWWRYALFMASKPWWLRLLVIAPLVLLSMLVFNFAGLLFLAYLRVSREIFQHMVRQELKTVTLRKGF